MFRDRLASSPRGVSYLCWVTCYLWMMVCFFGCPDRVSAQPPATTEVAFPDLAIPDSADLGALEALVAKAKGARPTTAVQYQTMQTAIQKASKLILQKLKDEEGSPRYQQAELDSITASVALMTYFGEDAKKKAVEQVHTFLKSREQLSISDVQTGIMAASMLELQPNKRPARDTYQLLDDLLKEDKREEMQSLRLNLQASIRRLELLGNKLELTATTLEGKKVSIDDFAGKFVIVDFFATWCGPCLTEFPRLKSHYEKYRSKGLEVIGISLDSDRKALNNYIVENEPSWPLIHDNHEDPLERLSMKFGVSQLPTVLLLNKEGTVVSLEARGSELDRLMQMLFETPTPAAPLEGAADAGKDSPDTDSENQKP